MDFLAQQLLAIKKKIIDHFKELDGKLSALNDGVSAISREVKTQAEAGKTPPTLQATLQVPTPLQVQTEPKEKKRWREIHKVAMETVTLLVVLAYSVVSYFQWREMRKTTSQVKRQIAMEHRAWLMLNTD